MTSFDVKNKNLLFQCYKVLSSYPRIREEDFANSLIRFIRSIGYRSFQDEAHNVIVQIKPSSGLEKAPRLLVQSHMDMVFLKERTADHDFSTDPIELVEDSGWLKARTTNLGAESTMGMAMILALLADPMPLPETRFIITSGRERGMIGAKSLESRYLDADILISLDAREQGTVFSSAAGESLGFFDIPLEPTIPDFDRAQAWISLDGLRGGDGGADLLDVRSNALKLLAEFLWRVDQKSRILIDDFFGKNADSVIPSQAEAIISFPKEDSQKIFEAMTEARDELSESLLKSDPDAHFSWDKISQPTLSFNHVSSQRLLNFISMMPHGVFTMKTGKDELESANNFFSVITENTGAKIRTSVFSSNKLKGQELEEKISKVVETFSGKGKFIEPFPAWIRREKSLARDLYLKLYQELTGKKALEQSFQSASECGIFQKKNPGLDIIAIGPDIKESHTLRERISLKSLEKTYFILRRLIAEIVQIQKQEGYNRINKLVNQKNI